MFTVLSGTEIEPDFYKRSPSLAVKDAVCHPRETKEINDDVTAALSERP